jgi:hypothetical protein
MTNTIWLLLALSMLVGCCAFPTDAGVRLSDGFRRLPDQQQPTPQWRRLGGDGRVPAPRRF